MFEYSFRQALGNTQAVQERHRIMKKIAIRILVLLAVFVVGVAGTSLLMNGEMSSDTMELNDASFRSAVHM